MLVADVRAFERRSLALFAVRAEVVAGAGVAGAGGVWRNEDDEKRGQVGDETRKVVSCQF